VARRGIVSDLSDGAGDALAGASSRGVATIGLTRHLRDVERRGGEEATAVGLNAALVRAVALAGLAHDLGKADPRFQLMLHGANPYRYELADEPLAKSTGGQSSFHERQREQKASCWPMGMRHEAVSAALVQALLRERPSLFDGIDADLVVHLVGTHHGRGRPLLPGVLDPYPQKVRASLPSYGSHGDSDVAAQSDEGIVDWDQPARFDRLNRRYGRWGLALLESLLRLADMVVSEGYEREKP
jgi:CRISPR-associated endonuclease/helicase Cas3